MLFYFANKHAMKIDLFVSFCPIWSVAFIGSLFRAVCFESRLAPGGIVHKLFRRSGNGPGKELYLKVVY